MIIKNYSAKNSIGFYLYVYLIKSNNPVLHLPILHLSKFNLIHQLILSRPKLLWNRHYWQPRKTGTYFIWLHYNSTVISVSKNFFLFVLDFITLLVLNMIEYFYFFSHNIDEIFCIRYHFVLIYFFFILREAAVQILKKAEMVLVGAEKRSQGLIIKSTI